jgi:hypothetical protein
MAPDFTGLHDFIRQGQDLLMRKAADDAAMFDLLRRGSVFASVMSSENPFSRLRPSRCGGSRGTRSNGREYSFRTSSLLGGTIQFVGMNRIGPWKD